MKMYQCVIASCRREYKAEWKGVYDKYCHHCPACAEREKARDMQEREYIDTSMEARRKAHSEGRFYPAIKRTLVGTSDWREMQDEKGNHYYLGQGY